MISTFGCDTEDKNMVDHVVTITLSKETYDYVRRLAEASAQSIEKLIQQRLMHMQPLPVLPDNEEAELAALHLLSDDALWTIAAEQMPRSQQARRSNLLELTKSGAISEREQAELDALLKRGDQLHFLLVPIGYYGAQGRS